MSNKDFKTDEPPTSGHPKDEDLVVASESQTTGVLFRVEVLNFSFLEENLLHVISPRCLSFHALYVA